MYRLVLIMAGIGFVTSSALAQTVTLDGWNGPLGMLGRYDSNHDNTLSSEEYVAGQRAGFKRTDASGDGRISFHELDSLLGDAPSAAVNARIAELKACDTDSDKKLSRDEYDACSAAKFRQIDSSGDGVVTPDEVAALQAQS